MEDFLNWEKTNKLHNLGYDGQTLMYIDDDDDILNDDTAELIGAKPAILTSSAFRWFRDKYNIQSSVKFSGSKIHYVFEIHFQKLANGENPPIMVWHHLDSWLGLNLDLFSTYEEAELACLTMLIEIVESKSE